MPVDGTFPTATSQWEKRSIADEIPIWDPDICIELRAVRPRLPARGNTDMKVYDPALFSGGMPDGMKAKEWTGRDAPGAHMTIQVAPDDCTGCAVCVSICPAKSKEAVKHRAINMEPKRAHLDVERAAWDAFLEIPERDRTKIKIDNVKAARCSNRCSSSPVRARAVVRRRTSS